GDTSVQIISENNTLEPNPPQHIAKRHPSTQIVHSLIASKLILLDLINIVSTLPGSLTTSTGKKSS
ncbi:hypothetical protein LINGRAHAP2_LOCUS32635, partial [Linum grandiflorum]